MDTYDPNSDIKRAAMSCSPQNTLPSHLISTLESSSVRKGARGIVSGNTLNQVVECGRILDARVVRLKVPEIAQGTKNGRGVIRNRLIRRVSSFLLDVGLVNPGRDEECGDTASNAIE